MNVTLDHYKKVEEEHELYCKMMCGQPHSQAVWGMRLASGVAALLKSINSSESHTGF